MDRSERRHRTSTFVAAQLRIAKTRQADAKVITQPGRLRKRHAMDCGNSQCGLCSNPRRLASGTEALTVQERRQPEAQREHGIDTLPLDTAPSQPAETALDLDL